MEPAVIAALVTAGSSLAVALWSFAATRLNQASLERLRADLGEHAAARQARRDYEYEAAKRLYREIEPLRFGSIVAAESAAARVVDLARAARDGHLDPGGSWLDDPDDDYFLQSTVYRMLAPLAWVRLGQAKLTTIDFSLDAGLRRWYLLARQASMSFSDDFVLAAATPSLRYDPDHPLDGGPTRSRQGVYVGLVEQAVDALVAEDSGFEGEAGADVLRFGSFLRRQNEDERVRVALEPMFDFFRGFHPERRPVAWRILLSQAVIYRALPSAADVTPGSAAELALTSDDLTLFEWRPAAHHCEEGDEVADDVTAAASYVASAFALAESVWERSNPDTPP
ncbi:MAG TPA: hypothetical protein VIT65_03805 [Microlunatus sp.]